jgi:hypothetical protein
MTTIQAVEKRTRELLNFSDRNGKKLAIWCDLDYTFCIPGRYDLFDASNCLEADKPNDFVIQILMRFRGTCRILFVTGRPEQYREVTGKQIETYFGYGWHLFMRQNDDWRSSVDYKRQQLHELENNFEFLFCLDDDEEVCKMLKNNGKNVLQVV